MFLFVSCSNTLQESLTNPSFEMVDAWLPGEGLGRMWGHIPGAPRLQTKTWLQTRSLSIIGACAVAAHFVFIDITVHQAPLMQEP